MYHHARCRIFCTIVFGLFLGGLLTACGGGGGGTATPAAPTTKTITVTIKDILGNPVKNVLVQLDQAGATATTNASGVATFTGAATGAHDIHMFPPAGSGLAWESVYQTTSNTIKWVMEKNDTSYVEFTGTLTNYTGNFLDLLLEDTAHGQGFTNTCSVTGSTYTCQIAANGFPIGSSGSFNLWAFQSNSVGDVTDAVKLQDIATYTVTTTAKGGTAVTQNISFNSVKPSTSNLLTIGTVTPPAGVTVQAIRGFMPVPLWGMQLGSSSAFGSPIVAYNPFPAGSNIWAVVDDQVGTTVTWRKFIKSTPGATLAASSSSFTSLPVIAAQIGTGQTNYKITFTPANGTSSFHQLTIYDSAGSKALWNLAVKSSSTSVTLPTIPTSVTPILASGATYKMQLIGAEIGNLTFEQAVAGKYDPTYNSYSDIEAVVSSKVGFTR